MEKIIESSRQFDTREEYKITHSKALSCKDVVGEIYKVTDWMLYQQDDQKGVMREVLCMITDNGNVSTVSETFKKAFFDIQEHFGLPFEIVIASGVSKAGRTFVTCELA